MTKVIDDREHLLAIDFLHDYMNYPTGLVTLLPFDVNFFHLDDIVMVKLLEMEEFENHLQNIDNRMYIPDYFFISRSDDFYSKQLGIRFSSNLFHQSDAPLP